MSDENDSHARSPSSDRGTGDLLVVALGASAGGIAALQEFFSHVPPHSGAAYVVILHLSPNHDSRLAEILQATTPLPVSQVGAKIALQADCIYVIAPNTILSISDGHLTCAPIQSAEDRRAPVDLLFRTLADAYGADAVSVVLSGTGPNGSNGLKRVKERGGLAIAQDPGEAEYGDMPKNSIATGLIDLVLPVSQIPAAIDRYRRRLRDPALAVPELDAIPTDAEALREILAQVRARTGHDFANYKVATILRRIQRRVLVLGLEGLPDYAAYLRRTADEAALLMKELLISVTHFFRDPEAFQTLETRVIPQLFHGKREMDQVRAWVVGCATGEEAYSVAILLCEHAQRLPVVPRIQVFASDLDERAIGVARDGFYTDAEVADLSQERLQRFFFREGAGYRVRRDLREMVLFALHNAIKDPPFSHLDLLTCRNLLIYLNRTVQERLVETFHFALRPRGHLFLGGSESPDGAGNLFLSVDKDAHIFESRPVLSRLALPVREPTLPRTGHERVAAVTALPERVFPIDVHHRLIEAYGPPSLVVSEDHVLLHVSQGATAYLKVARGEPSRNILQLIHPDLRLDLRTALYEAAQQRREVHIRDIRLRLHDDAETSCSIRVKPILREGDAGRGLFLILLEEHSTVRPAATDTLQLQSPGAQLNADLDEELSRVRAQLARTIEQSETQFEEARAANEELQAVNEELRSSTEELETSKEELQSVNEELTTVNQELKIKVEELRLTNNDFQNFINATNIPTIFLDRSLRVKFSTSRAQDIFNLLPTDVGRRLSDITTKLTYPALLDDATHVLEQLHTIHREVRTHDGDLFLVRVLPYRTSDDRIEGVVLTFIDVTALRQAEAEVLASEERLRLLIDSASDYAIFTIDRDGLIESWNTGAERIWGYRAAEIVGQAFEQLFMPEDRAAGVAARELATARQDGRAVDERMHLRADGTTFYASGVTTRLGEDARLGFAKIARDLTEARRSAEMLERAHAELEQRVAERTAVLTEQQEHIRGLLRQLVTAQEEQRGRIARDLHDQLGQQITALRLALEHGQATHAADDCADPIERALALAREISREVDFLAWELRPAVLDDLGLAAALPRFIQEWSLHYGIEGEFRLVGFRPGDLSKDAEVSYYRIAQEALNNVLKHAHAQRMDLVLETRADQVSLIVADDGIGFDMSSPSAEGGGGFGMFSMKERAALVGATLEVESIPGHGTTVYLRCPVSAPSREGT
jgi:two-component system CheB/CheR fusion protein